MERKEAYHKGSVRSSACHIIEFLQLLGLLPGTAYTQISAWLNLPCPPLLAGFCSEVLDLLFPSLIICPPLPHPLNPLSLFHVYIFHPTDYTYFNFLSPNHQNINFMSTGLSFLLTASSSVLRRYLIHGRCSINHFEEVNEYEETEALCYITCLKSPGK